MQTQRSLRATSLVPLFALLAALSGCESKESTPQRSATVPAAQPHPADKTSTPVVSREEFTKLAKEIGCFSCHSIDKKLLGPAWKHVAGIYRNDPAAEDKMMDKIAKGGSGAWGNIAMPGYPDLSEEKRRILVKFILSLE